MIELRLLVDPIGRNGEKDVDVLNVPIRCRGLGRIE